MDLLCGSFIDIAGQNGIEYTSGILNGYSLARSVPTGVHQEGPGPGLTHSLQKLRSILERLKLQESLSEAG